MKELYEWYEDGCYEHVTAYLMERDLREFDPKAPPLKTPAFWAIADANRAPEETELMDLIDELENPDALRIDSLVMSAVRMGNQELVQWLRDRKNNRTLPHRIAKCGYIAVHNNDTKDRQWMVDGKRQTIYAKKSLLLRDQYIAATKLTMTR